MLEVLGETHNGVEPQALYTSMPKDIIDYDKTIYPHFTLEKWFINI